MERNASNQDTVKDNSYDPNKDLSENIDLKYEQLVEKRVDQFEGYSSYLQISYSGRIVVNTGEGFFCLWAH